MASENVESDPRVPRGRQEKKGRCYQNLSVARSRGKYQEEVDQKEKKIERKRLRYPKNEPKKILLKMARLRKNGWARASRLTRPH